METDLLYYLLITGLAIVILLTGEALHRLLNVKPEYTRKMVHVMIGLIPLFYPSIFTSHLPVLILNGQLIGLLIIGKIFSFLPSINNIKRNSLGEYLYPVSAYLVFLLFLETGNRAAYYIPLLVLTVSDTGAAISGMAYRSHQQAKPGARIIEILKTGKTVVGSGLFLITSLIIAMMLIPVFSAVPTGLSILCAITISIVTTTVELFSRNGWDNLSIPLSVILVLLLFGI